MRPLLLVLLISLSSLSLAEMIGGHDLGGKFTRVDEAEKLEGMESYFPNVYEMKADSFFDKVQIEADSNNVVHGLVFVKEYSFTAATLSVDKQDIKADFERVLHHLESKYGEFDKSGAERLLGFIGSTNTFYLQKISEAAALKRSESPVFIVLMLAGDEGDGYMMGGEKTVTISLMYMDEVLADAAKRDNNAKNDLSGF